MKSSKGLIATAVGLMIGAGVAALLGHLFSAAAIRGQSDQIARRQAIMRVMSLADLIGAAGDEQSIQNVLLEWVAADSGTSQIQVVSGRNLLASTLRDDISGSLPRRLKREEKDFFDLAKELKAGLDTNLEEGVYRKDEIDLVVLDQGRLQATAPYFLRDQFKGVVRVVSIPKFEAAPIGGLMAWLLLVVPVVLFLAFSWAFSNYSLGKWRLTAVAALLLIGCMTWFASNRLHAFRSYRLDVESGLAHHYLLCKNLVVQLAEGQGFDWRPPAENVYDTDVYRRPLGYVTGEGTLVRDTVEASLSAKLASLKKGFVGNAVLALIILSFFGSGMVGRLWRTVVEHRQAYAYVSPAILGMLILVFFPFFFGIVLSFTGQTLYNTDKPLTEIFVGFRNFAEILGDFEILTRSNDGWVINYDNFYWTLFITICWTVFNVVIGVTVGLGLALALNNKTLVGKPIYRAILILPWAIPNYVTSLIWKGLFHKQFGAINQMLQFLGLEPIAWFDSVFTSFITGITVNGWLSFPFMMVICLGALQSVSQDMYEAARLDGASRWQQFRYITLPSLKPTLIPAIIISVIWTFNMFNIIYLVSGGQPGGANEILITQAFKVAFEKYQYGYGAAYATVIFLILLAYGVFQTKMTRATEDIAK